MHIAHSVSEATLEETGNVEINSKPLAVAIRTPPYKLVLSKALDLNALTLIARDVQDDGKPLPGVSGPMAEVEIFLQTWQTLTGQSYWRVMEMRIYQLTQVKPVTTVGGQLKLATEADRPFSPDGI